jgi:hypothetical protein
VNIILTQMFDRLGDVNVCHRHEKSRSSSITVKINLSLFYFLTEPHAMEAYWESGGIAPLILLSQH